MPIYLALLVEGGSQECLCHCPDGFDALYLVGPRDIGTDLQGLIEDVLVRE
jgi:hypothetical protein